MTYLLGCDILGAESEWSVFASAAPWDLAVVTRAFDATPKKTYGAIVKLAPIAAYIVSKTPDVAGTSGPKKVVDNLTRAVLLAAGKSVTAKASESDWTFFRTWFLQAFIEFNAGTESAQYLAERQSFWREVTEQWEEVKTQLADVASGAVSSTLGAAAKAVPWWVWVVGGVIVIGVVGIPVVAPIVASYVSRKTIVVHRST